METKSLSIVATVMGLSGDAEAMFAAATVSAQSVRAYLDRAREVIPRWVSDADLLATSLGLLSEEKTWASAELMRGEEDEGGGVSFQDAKSMGMMKEESGEAFILIMAAVPGKGKKEGWEKRIAERIAKKGAERLKRVFGEEAEMTTSRVSSGDATKKGRVALEARVLGEAAKETEKRKRAKI